MAITDFDYGPWSIPPVTSDGSLPDNISILPGPSTTNEIRIPLRKGIVCRVEMNRPWLIQNVNQNEDDVIEFSFHGDKDGTWNILNAHCAVKARTKMFFLNRTNIDTMYLAICPQ